MTLSISKRLYESVTPPGIMEWMETWRTMTPDHVQYYMREEQLEIGREALKLSGILTRDE